MRWLSSTMLYPCRHNTHRSTCKYIHTKSKLQPRHTFDVPQRRDRDHSTVSNAAADPAPCREGTYKAVLTEAAATTQLKQASSKVTRAAYQVLRVAYDHRDAGQLHQHRMVAIPADVVDHTFELLVADCVQHLRSLNMNCWDSMAPA